MHLILIFVCQIYEKNEKVDDSNVAEQENSKIQLKKAQEEESLLRGADKV